MPISSIYQIYKEMHTTRMTGGLNYSMKSVCEWLLICNGFLLALNFQFLDPAFTVPDKFLNGQKLAQNGLSFTRDPSRTVQVFLTGKRKGIWARDRARGRKFPSLPPPPPPFLPPSRPSCFCRSQNPLHFPFERLPCKVICNRIYTVPCERVAQVKNSSAEKSKKFDRTFVKGVQVSLFSVS